MPDHRDLPADLNTLLLRLYRLSQELPIQLFQDAALAQIKQVLPFEASMWGTVTTTPDGIDIHTVHLHQKSPEMLVAYEAVKHLDSAAASLFGKPHVTRTFHAARWFAGAGSRDMLAFLRRFRQENVFIAADSNPHTHFVHWFSLYRADPHAHCQDSERLLLAQLAPHVMQALALNRVMHLGQLEAADKAMSPYGKRLPMHVACCTTPIRYLWLGRRPNGAIGVAPRCPRHSRFISRLPAMTVWLGTPRWCAATLSMGCCF